MALLSGHDGDCVVQRTLSVQHMEKKLRRSEKLSTQGAVIGSIGFLEDSAGDRSII
jgi:hypothetical protein